MMTNNDSRPHTHILYICVCVLKKAGQRIFNGFTIKKECVFEERDRITLEH